MSGSTSPLPLSALLSRALVDLTREFERTREGEGRTALSLVLWSTFLRVLDGDGVPQRDLPGLARVSRRTMTATVDGMQRLGLAQVAPMADGKRGKVVGLTELGFQVQESWRPLVADAEARWHERLGRDASEAREQLQRVVAALDIELSHYPIGYGPADPSMVGGTSVPGRAGPPRLPAHGTDWRPVVRADDDTADLPTSALLSQCLVAFAIDYEALSHFPLALVANVLRFVDGDECPLDLFPRIAGVSGAGTSLLERHGIVTVTSNKVVILTTRGRQVRDLYAPLIARVESDWEEAHGTDVGQLRAALEAVDQHLPADLPHFPMVVFEGGAFVEVSNLRGR